MKEPELEEESLTATVMADRLVILGRSLSAGDRDVTVTRPSGSTTTARLSAGADGIARGELPVDEAGLWRINDGSRTAFAAAGRINPRELADLRASDAVLGPLVQATRGGAIWLATEPFPEVRRVGRDAAGAGSGWLGVEHNDASAVTGVRQVPLMPLFLVLGLVLAAVSLAWWRESR
jgi:hypothetical protein